MLSGLSLLSDSLMLLSTKMVRIMLVLMLYHAIIPCMLSQLGINFFFGLETIKELYMHDVEFKDAF
jgi:hypothetical protein